MNKYNVGLAWVVTEQEFDFDLHKFLIEGATDKNSYGWIYPDNLGQQDQLRGELAGGTFDINEWPIEWSNSMDHGYSGY